MTDITIQNIVASTIFAENLDLDKIAISIEKSEYEPEQFPGLTFRIEDPKTATLLFRSGKGICTGANKLGDVKKSIEIIADKLQKIGLHIYKKKDLEIIVRNMVATANLHGEMNLTEVAMGLGLENIEYEPEQFPGLVYRIQEPKVVMLLFSSGKIVCTGGKTKEEVSRAVKELSNILAQLDLLH